MISTRLQPGMPATPSMFIHQGRAMSKPLELSTLAFLITSSKTCKGNEWMLRGGAGGGSGKYRAMQWQGVRSEGGFTHTVDCNKRE